MQVMDLVVFIWGDHFSGRDKIEHGYNHLLLNHKEYLNYYNKMLVK